jgi:hypothetical protein
MAIDHHCGRRRHVGESRDEVVADFLHLARHACPCEPYGGSVVSVDPSTIRDLLEAIIAGFSVLGGAMACLSGLHAARALAKEAPPAVVAERVNEGIGQGFMYFWPSSIAALIISAWT